MEAPDNRLLLQIISPTSRFAHKSFCLQVCLIQKSSRQQVGSPTSHLIHESHVISHTGWLTQKSSLLHVSFAYKSFRLWVNSPTSPLAHRFLCPQLISSLVTFTYKSSRRRVGSPTSHSTYGSVSPTNYLSDGSARAEINLPTMSVSLQARVQVAFSLIFGTCTERLLRERELSTKIYLGTEVKFCQVCNKH